MKRFSMVIGLLVLLPSLAAAAGLPTISVGIS